MSNAINLKLRQKSPYKTLLSGSKLKLSSQQARKVYLSEFPSKRNAPTRSAQEQYQRKYYNSSRNIIKDLRLNFNKQNYNSQEKQHFSDRNAIEKKQSLLSKNQVHSGRHSKFGKSKLYSANSKMDKSGADKSTIISTLLSQQREREQRVKEDRLRHGEGKNCRIIIIEDSEEVEHFVEVNKTADVITFLKGEYPKVSYFKAVPVQITLDYLLTQADIAGGFLNGQTLYLKPVFKENSFDGMESLCMGNFQILKLVGSGGFSRVFLCRYKKDGNFYAMKVIDKETIVKNKKKNIIMNERNIMKNLSHPFLIDMKFSFETQKHLIFVLEYCPGGELFGLIKKYKRISEQISRFYIIQIFLGLSYLHQNNVVYRDIKPENILLGQDGHVKIADLGLAKPDMFEGELAFSFCGSPEYMSPEMILQVGHTYPVDFYCMGALLYELLIGLPPFYSRDTNEIYQSVLSQELNFPEDVHLTAECKSLLRGLLCKDSKQRLGSIHGVKEILAHPWFGKNSYKNFLEKKIVPPITFDSVGRIDLDRQVDEKKNKQVEELQRAHKSETFKFKREMKHFYYDFTGETEEYSESRKDNKENKEKGLLRSASSRRLNSKNNRSINLLGNLNRKSSEKEINKTLNSLNSSRR